MEAGKYKPRDKLAIHIARDLLRTLDVKGSEKNAKILCFYAEMVFNDARIS